MRILRPIVIPILILLYLSAGVLLCGRQVFHHLTKFMDWAFDVIAYCAAWDTTYWPLPKASDNPLEKI